MPVFPNEILLLIAEQADVNTLKSWSLTCQFFLGTASFRNKLFEHVVIKASSPAPLDASKSPLSPDAMRSIRMLTFFAPRVNNSPAAYPPHTQQLIKSCAPSLTQLKFRHDEDFISAEHRCYIFSKWNEILYSFKFSSLTTLCIALHPMTFVCVRQLFDSPHWAPKDAIEIFNQNISQINSLQLTLKNRDDPFTEDSKAYNFYHLLNLFRWEYTLKGASLSSLDVQGKQSKLMCGNDWWGTRSTKVCGNIRKIKLTGLDIEDDPRLMLKQLHALEELDIFCCSLNWQRDNWTRVLESLKEKDNLRKLVLGCLHYSEIDPKVFSKNQNIRNEQKRRLSNAFNQTEFLDLLDDFILEKGINRVTEIDNLHKCKQCQRCGPVELCFGPNGCCRRLY